MTGIEGPFKELDCFVAFAPRNDGQFYLHFARSKFPRIPMPDTHPLAGQIVPPSMLANIPRLVTAYFATKPDPKDPAQRVAFGTSGHRGSSLHGAFNEAHILAISQAICDYRRERGIDGPLYVGKDTHAL